MSVLGEYAKSAVNTAQRIKVGIERIEGGDPRLLDRNRVNALADCAELQELANRMYVILYSRGVQLPGVLDPLTMRFRELGTNDNVTISGNNSGKSAGMAPGMEAAPSTQTRDDGKPQGETETPA